MIFTSETAAARALASKTDKPAQRLHSLALFCRVVDNYGDIGICWRLARQLHVEHGICVTLWVDDLDTFNRLCPHVSFGVEVQKIAGVVVRHWRPHETTFRFGPVADIVIEFFGCNIPDDYIAAMVTRVPKPVWLNLEGLSAESWVEGCHTLPSPHPRLPLTKYFFFPGFTGKTGGLLVESSLHEERLRFQAEHGGMAEFLAGYGVLPAEAASFKVSLFCYPRAPVDALFAAWENSDHAILCLVPEGVAVDAVQAFLGSGATAGAVKTRRALTVRVLPFLPQPDYDRLLWACDVNFVRGEDSFVRAQWAGKPFIWHIYPQEENLHHKKLRAFLQRYACGFDSLDALSLEWNGAVDAGNSDLSEQRQWSSLWQQFEADLSGIAGRTKDWEGKMRHNGDLASNLMQFANRVHLVTTESKV